MKPLPLLLLAAEAGEELTAEDWYRLRVEAERAAEYAKRLKAVVGWGKCKSN